MMQRNALPWVWIALAGVWTFACATTTGGDSSSHWVRCKVEADCADAGPGLSCIGGLCMPGTERDASRRDDAASESRHDAAPRDAQITGALESDASRAFIGGDAGPTPPSYCVAPCVWEMVRHCIPILNQCLVQNVQPGFFPTITCDPLSGWSTAASPSKLGLGFTVSRNGASCYFSDFVEPQPPSTMFRSHQYSDFTGATAIQPESGPVYCGATGVDLAAAILDAGALRKPGITAYPQHPERPECAAWDQNGMPKLPPCETSDSGTCP